MVGYFIMTDISYVTDQSDHGNKLGEYGNPWSLAENIWMIIDNILIRHIYAAHVIIVVIQLTCNIEMNLTLFSPDVGHMDIFLLVIFWTYPKKF